MRSLPSSLCLVTQQHQEEDESSYTQLERTWTIHSNSLLVKLVNTQIFRVIGSLQRLIFFIIMKLNLWFWQYSLTWSQRTIWWNNWLMKTEPSKSNFIHKAHFLNIVFNIKLPFGGQLLYIDHNNPPLLFKRLTSIPLCKVIYSISKSRCSSSILHCLEVPCQDIFWDSSQILSCELPYNEKKTIFSTHNNTE